MKSGASQIWEYNVNSNMVETCSDAATNLYPYLLIDIGSSVSFIKVMGPGSQYERIGDTPLGGGMFSGLIRLIQGVEDFDKLLALVSMGDHRAVDLLVENIYGGNYDSIGMDSDSVASSFAKVYQVSENASNTASLPRPEDVAASLHHALRYVETDFSFSLRFSIQIYLFVFLNVS